MKRKQPRNPSEIGRTLAPTESALLNGLEPLVEHCAVLRYDDGSVRTPGWFTVATSGSAWRVTVKDPDGCCSFVTVAETLDKALETAALLLAADECPWQHDQFLANGSAGKRRKN